MKKLKGYGSRWDPEGKYHSLLVMPYAQCGYVHGEVVNLTQAEWDAVPIERKCKKCLRQPR